MSRINETIIQVNNSGLHVVPETYARENHIAGVVDKVSLTVSTASGIANNGSAWLGISGEETILQMTGLTGTTTVVDYPRRFVDNVSGTTQTGVSGTNAFTPFAIAPGQTLYMAGSGWGSGTNLSVGATMHVYWHKP